MFTKQMVRIPVVFALFGFVIPLVLRLLELGGYFGYFVGWLLFPTRLFIEIYMAPIGDKLGWFLGPLLLFINGGFWLLVGVAFDKAREKSLGLALIVSLFTYVVLGLAFNHLFLCWFEGCADHWNLWRQ